MSATEYVILVNEEDQELGQAEKMEAHVNNLLHRAFSVFIFRKNPLELLLQKRSQGKYHSPGLWTNSCCSHPRPGETIIEGAERRLQEELGIQTPLKVIDKFHYNVSFENGLSENEIDYVLIGYLDTDTAITPNKHEVDDHRFISVDELKNEMQKNPSKFTPWLQQALTVLEVNLI